MIQRGAYGPTNLLIQSAQAFVTSWADLGIEIDTRGFNTIAIWLKITANNSTNLRIRCLAHHTSAHADNYKLPIISITADGNYIHNEFFEYTHSENQLGIVSINIGNIIPFCQFQISTMATGVTAATVDTALYSTGY